MAVWKIISVFIFISVFWALFDQHSSTWIEQAKAMDRVVELSTTGNYLTGIGIGLLFVVIIALSAGKELPVWAMMAAGATVGGVVYWITGVAGQRSYGMWEWITLTGIMAGGAGAFFGIGQVNRSKWLICAVFLGLGAGVGYALTHIGRIELQPSQIPALNPFMVMVLIPLTTFGLYPLMKKIGINPHPLRRMTMGMMVAGISFVLVALLQAKLDSGEKVHVVWQVLPYLVITLAEVMVSITGLEFAYSQAPKRMKSVIMGFWLFNVTLGNLLVAVIAQMPDMAPEKFFWTFAGMMFGAGALFGLRGKFYKYKDYTQDAETPGDKETAETFA
jgi:dipeptide/tripeptide permease